MLNNSGIATWLQQYGCIQLAAVWLQNKTVAHFASHQGGQHMDIPDFLKHAAYRANVMLVCMCVCVCVCVCVCMCVCERERDR